MSRGGRLCHSFARNARYSGRLLVASERLRRRTARGFYRKDAKGTMLIPSETDSHRPCSTSVILGTTEERLCRSFARDARYSGQLLVASERLRRRTARGFYRKDAKEARLAPSETDQPRFLHCQESTAREGNSKNTRLCCTFRNTRAAPTKSQRSVLEQEKGRRGNSRTPRTLTTSRTRQILS